MMDLIAIECAAKCGATDKVPAFEDRLEKDPAKRIKPVQVHPYVCLSCWRAGWRSKGEEVYLDPNAPKPAKSLLLGVP